DRGDGRAARHAAAVEVACSKTESRQTDCFCPCDGRGMQTDNAVEDPEASHGPTIRHRLIGVLLVLLSGAALAIVPTSAKLAFESSANTLTVVTLRGVVGLALMALFMAAAGQSFRIPARTLTPCATAGLAHAVVAYGFIGSVAHIPVGLAVLIYATHP